MKSKRIQSAFNEFKNIVESGPVSSEYKHEDKQRRMAIENIMKSYDSILSSSDYDDKDDENAELTSNDIIQMTKNIGNFFFSMRAKLIHVSAQVCKNAAKYFNVIGKKYEIFYVKQDKKESEEITKRYKDSYKEIMKFTKDIMEGSGFLDALIMREFRSLKEVQMGDLFTLEELYAKKDEMINPNLVDFANDIEASLIAAFWLNKVTKVIEDCKQGYIVERTMLDSRLNTAYNGYSKEDLQDISLKRYKFINQIIKEAVDKYNENDDFKGFNLSEYVEYLRYIKDRNDDDELKGFFEEDSPGKRDFYSQPGIQEFTNEILEYEDAYNKLLANDGEDNKSGFIADLRTVAFIHDCMHSFYDAKTELTAIGMLAIAAAERSSKLITGSPRWGINQDEKLEEDGRVSKILIADLPGYMKPVSLHLEKIVYDAFQKFGVEQTYEGIFDCGDREYTNGYSVNVLFRLSEKERIKLKQIANKNKQQIMDNRRLLDRIIKKRKMAEIGESTENQSKEQNESKKKKNKSPNPKFEKRAKDENINPNTLMRSIIYDMSMYKVQREMCACATKEYAKWLGEDKLLDAPFSEI